MEQLPLAASVVPQALAPVVMAKSVGLVPVIVMLSIVSAAVPVLLTVMARGAEVTPTVVFGKASEEGVSVTVAVETIAKLAVTLCGAFIVTVVEALLELDTVPVQLLKV
jgi:hypothetical protein